ncbi:MAG TPA: hypothetical protein VKC61_16600 [Pyrinomonadaceae bacterium]|nr:hypothetical protein [Pyrinomonadaceae bacterium]
MSKRINRFIALLFLLALGMATLLAKHDLRVSAQRANVAGSNVRNAAIVTTTAEVLKETSEIRELAILRPVRSGGQSRSEIERMLIKNLNEQMTPAEMHATDVSLRKFGLAPADFDYRSFMIKLLTEQVAGYYDAKAQEFHLADWLELEGQKPVMAHELTHALQDQHFNLRRFEKWPHGDSDAELAAHSLIEGDATLAMMVYMAKNPLVALAFGRSLTTGVATEQYDKAPRAMRESLIFPYLQGSEWATQLYRKGGWTMVSNAFTKLPLSTEQILHAEKYFNYERPIKIVLPDVTNLLNGRSEQAANRKEQTTANIQRPDVRGRRSSGTAGVPPASRRTRASRRQTTSHPPLPTADSPLPATSWHRIESDVNGEWTYYLILDQFLNAPAESKRAAAGWAGDRYGLYEGPNGQVFLSQLTFWDTENDAREFFDAYVKRTELRYPGAQRIDSASSQPETRNPKIETTLSYSWQTSEGVVVIEVRGLRVTILEGVPDGVEPSTLMKEFRYYCPPSMTSDCGPKA